MARLDAFSVRTYSERIGMVAQQMDTRLSKTVMREPLTGQQRHWRAYGSVELVDLDDQIGETNWTDIPRLQRIISRKSFALPLLFGHNDHIDLGKELEPNGQIRQSLTAAGYRKIDSTILTAFDATAYGGDEGTTTFAFDTTNQVVDNAAASALTVLKVANAKDILDTNEYPEDGRFLVVHSRNLRQLLTDTTLSPASYDYNEIKALVEGRLTHWLGFEIIRYNGIPLNNTDKRYAFAFHKSAMIYGVDREVDIKEGEVPERNFAWGVEIFLSCAATRVFETGVVRINNTTT